MPLLYERCYDYHVPSSNPHQIFTDLKVFSTFSIVIAATEMSTSNRLAKDAKHSRLNINMWSLEKNRVCSFKTYFLRDEINYEVSESIRNIPMLYTLNYNIVLRYP